MYIYTLIVVYSFVDIYDTQILTYMHIHIYMQVYLYIYIFMRRKKNVLPLEKFRTQLNALT